MPDLIIYPYGKPIKVRWENEAQPPSPEEVDFIVSDYKRRFPQGSSAGPVNTGRMPSRLEGKLGGQPTGGYAPVQPFAPGIGVQDNSGKPVQKPAITNPNIVRDRPAPKSIGFTPQDYPASKAPVTKKPNIPNQQVPITNPALQQFAQPNVAQQFQQATNINTPQGKANAQKAIQQERKKPMASGSVEVPGIGSVKWEQHGPGLVANVPGLGVIKAANPQVLAKKIHQGFVDFKLKAETPAASPNRADVVPNENLVPGNVDRFGASNFITLPSGQKKVKQNLTDRERLDVWNQRIGEMSQSLASGVKHVLPMGMSQDVAELFGIKAPDSVKAINHFLADQVAGVAMMPIDAIGDGLVLGSPEFTPAEKAGAVANITLKLTGSGIGTETVHQITGLIGQGFKRFGTKFMPSFMDLMSANPERAAQAYAKIGLKPAQVEEVVQRTHKRVDLPMYEPKPVRSEIDAKKAELDARRAARKAETEGPLRQGQGIKVNGQQAEVVGTQGDTVTIRYQDGQVRDVKKSKLNAKPEPTPEATTQPVPTEPKPVSEPSVTAPKATKEPVQNVTGGVKESISARAENGNLEPWQMTRKDFGVFRKPKGGAAKTIVREISPNKWVVRAMQGQDEVGKAIFVKTDRGLSLEPASMVYVEPSARRQGIGSSLYEAIESHTGDSVIPSGTRTGEGNALWLNRNRSFGHKDYVDEALYEGKPVPPEVLADYPDLAAKYKQPTPNTPKPVEAPQKPVQAPETASVKGTSSVNETAQNETRVAAVSETAKGKIEPNPSSKQPQKTLQADRRLTVGGTDFETGGAKTEIVKASPIDIGGPSEIQYYIGRRSADGRWIISDGNTAPIGFGATRAEAVAKAESFWAKSSTSKLSAVSSEIEAVKARRDARLKATTKKQGKRGGYEDFTKEDIGDAIELAELYIKKAGYTFEQYAKEMVDYFGDGVKPHLKEIWDTHAPVKAVPKVSAPKVEPKTNGEDVTGVAKQVTGRDPMKGVSREELDTIGKEVLLKDANAVSKAVKRVKEEGKAMDENEIAASAVRLRQIANRESEIRGEIDSAKETTDLFRLNQETIALETEREAILQATDYSLNRGFHRMGIAAQLVHKPDFSLGMLKARAKAALLKTVEVVPKHIETKLASYASTIDRLNADLDAARKQIHDLINKGTFKRGSRENNVKRLRKFFGEESGAYEPMASKNTRQRGAVYTIPDAEKDAMAAMRSLAKQLADDGAKNLDEIVEGIRKEVGKNIPEETIYRMLSDKYRRYLLESDVAKIDANRYLRDIQRGAEFKLRGPLEKSLSVASDILGGTARSMQAGWDISAPFIQGRKGLIANPVGWMKAWENQLKAYRHGDEVVIKRLAEMERHPMYSRFIAAGGDKLLRRPGGHFSAQEETFANNFMRMATEAMDKGGAVGKYNPANLYLKGLERSDAAFSAFMNDLTWDTFLKFAEAAPNDPAFLRDSVHNLGIIYGRGTGPLADLIGRSKAGNVFYAPRYTLSQMQYAATPIRALSPKAYETAAGRIQALKTYGTQAAAYGTLVALARLAGWDIETDIRSSDFGSVALPGGRRLDIFGKESQAYRLVANIVAGRINKKNEYEKPGIVTAWKSVGQFGFGKLAPGPRLPSDVLFGSFDPDKGATPFTMAEFGKRYLPLWVQQTLQNGDLATIPLAILGQDVSKNQKPGLTDETRNKQYPMELPKINQKPDALGRPIDEAQAKQDADVIGELKRLGIELKWPDKRETDTDEEFKKRAKAQGDAVRDAVRKQMAAPAYGEIPSYKDMTVTQKREAIKAEITRAKTDFNRDYNESEKTRKEDERLKQIEKELAAGRK